MAGLASRIDNFTDAAFAFSLSLLVIGQAGVPGSAGELQAAMADIPAFAIGFSILAMFWYAHVRWRGMRGEGGPLSVLLTIALVFVVLVYVRPLQAMAVSFSSFFGGGGTRFQGSLGDLFLIYGAGFTTMAALTAALFWNVARDRGIAEDTRTVARGEAIIWLVLVATGGLSTLFSAFPATERIAPWLYATLPATIGVFAQRYRWPPSSKATSGS